MARTLPPVTWFRSFEAAARTLSFTAAAEEIGLTQSAVSQQVKSLEIRLGVPLFLRRPRGLALTDAGRNLLPQVGSALEALAQATERVGSDPGGDLLTIATSVSVADWLIAPHFLNFTARHPGLRVRLLSAVWPDDFNSSRADVQVRFGSAKQVGRNARLMEPSGLVALKAPGLDGPLAGLPLIDTVGTSAGWTAWSREIGSVGEVAAYADTFGMALHLAAHGAGVALVGEVLAGHALATGRLVRAHEARLSSAEGYYLSADPTRPAALAFASWLTGLTGRGDTSREVELPAEMSQTPFPPDASDV